jgi:hypothetical protein
MTASVTGDFQARSELAEEGGRKRQMGKVAGWQVNMRWLLRGLEVNNLSEKSLTGLQANILYMKRAATTK